VKIRLAPRALQRARHIKTWLQKNRPGAEVIFDQEFDRLTRKLASMSARSPLGVIDGARRGKTIWRVRLPKSQQRVYYSIDELHDAVVVRTIWGARRGRSPKL
jgi:plasmid stabilization system protein ParE